MPTTETLGTFTEVVGFFGSLFGENDAEFCRNTADAIDQYLLNNRQVLPGALRIFDTSGTGSWPRIQAICPGVPDRMIIHLEKLRRGHPFSSLDQRDPILPQVRIEAERQGLLAPSTLGGLLSTGGVRTAGVGGGISPLVLLLGAGLLFFFLSPPKAS
jgi:hypothetical protein